MKRPHSAEPTQLHLGRYILTNSAGRPEITWLAIFWLYLIHFMEDFGCVKSKIGQEAPYEVR